MQQASLSALAMAVPLAAQAKQEAKPLPPKPANQLSPDEALARLMEGNDRYAQGLMRRHDFINEREALAGGQNPFAVILSCADSRIAPEYAFDSARGDLFVVRVAGNFASDDGIGSIEYAVAVLGTPLIMVLGHEQCGAVGASIKLRKDNARFPGRIQGLAETLVPSVDKVLDKPGDLLRNAIKQNVADTVTRLKLASPVLADSLAQGQLKIAGGVYRLETGRIDIIVPA